MVYPSLKQVKVLAHQYRTIPVSMEVTADMETPITLFKRFEDEKFCFLLESVEGGEKWGRYSFIGRRPFAVFKSNGEKINIQYKNGKIEEITRNPADLLKELLQKYKSPYVEGLPRFNGGAVGYFGYDFIRQYEDLPNMPNDDVGLPEIQFMFADEVIAFDHLKQKIQIVVNIHPGNNVERDYNTAVERIKEIQREIISSRWKLRYSESNRLNFNNSKLDFQSSISKQEFCSMVKKAKNYIRNGDIFQVVLSQRLCTKTNVSPFNVYRVLRSINPSPYMYYLKLGDCKLVGSSPEMLVRVQQGIVETCPIAGTRKRGKTQEEDKRLEKELLTDHKELAEHTMLVDLARNDIGRVARCGTVCVDNLMHVERYSHVMHIVTNVKGKLMEGKTPFDALMSVFPAGTLSGAPKIRAMEIIDELEPVKRGPYGGAIGYLSFNGNLDSCITIRTIVFKGDKAYIQAGAGIVADSDAEKEYQECFNKAGALMDALNKAGDAE